MYEGLSPRLPEPATLLIIGRDIQSITQQVFLTMFVRG